MPSENVVTATEPDRRTRKRGVRRDHLLDLADDLIDERGLDGLTMAALAEAADYAPASLYTYFASRDAVVSALQARALEVLRVVGEEHVARWDEALPHPAGARQRRVGALARLLGFAEVLLTAPEHHPRELRLQQELLTQPQGDSSEGALVLAAAMAVLDVPRRLLADAAAVRALAAPSALPNAAGDPVDGSMARTLAWVSALNGTLLVDRLGGTVPVEGLALGREVTRSMLRGWGADATELADAQSILDTWSSR